MFEKIENCPICQSKEIENFLTCKDHMLTGESFAITKCTTCQFLFTNPRPTSAEIGKYYQSDQYISHTNSATNLTGLIYKIARKYTLSKKIKLINSLTPSKSTHNILDFGCGTGEFLNACKGASWNVFGFEPNENARRQASEKTKSSIYHDLAELKNIPSLDIISLWHVLEHIHDIDGTISELKSKLAKHGKMIVAVPNAQSLDAKHYQEYWAAYDVPRHLYHFTQKTMKLLMQNHGLKIIKTIPLPLDAFYVSLLSEKYSSGSQNFTKAFTKGYESNNYAKINKNNYSSLIYVVGK